MKERILIYLPLLLFIAAFIYIMFMFELPITKDIVIFEKKVDRIIIKGSVVSTDKKTLRDETFKYELNLVKKPGEEKFALDYDKSLLPRVMTVDSVITETKYDFLAPFRIGIGVNYKEERLDKDLICAYLFIRKARFELGPMTDFESLGLMVSHRTGNMSFGGYATLAGTLGIGVGFKPF